MKNKFALQAGSVPGMNHILPGQPGWENNQDAFALRQSTQASIAVVCDGCGSGSHSEVGASITAQLVATRILEMVDHSFVASLSDVSGLEDDFWKRLRLDVLAEIRVLARRMGGSFSQTISDYFLTTVLGILVLPEHTYVFSIGDGMYIVNGDRKELEPLSGNRPPYLAYALTETSFAEDIKDLLYFDVEKFPTKDIDSVLLCSDGVLDVIAAESKTLPRGSGPVGPVSQFWEKKSYTVNPDAIRRRLACLNLETATQNPAGNPRIKRGLLPDDTTIILLRRRQSKKKGDSHEDTTE